HRITRPQLPWDTQYDFFGMTRSTLVLDLQLDEQGNVSLVTILRSSGSPSVDQPCRLAAYQWWFEPAKDPTGHPTRDEIQFTIKFF
ncbi:MAG: energy transducer TonB, partial [Phycisphaerae bacterium]|nr:energy transducer TonB [Phycisphaerae bacterium]